MGETLTAGTTGHADGLTRAYTPVDSGGLERVLNMRLCGASTYMLRMPTCGSRPTAWQSETARRPATVGAAGNTAATDRAALVALYNATSGPNWTINTNWLTTAALSEWYGVTTDVDGRVTHVYLAQNELNGELPVELGDLTNLRSCISCISNQNMLSGARRRWGI